MDELNYNYVVLGSTDEYYMLSYSDLNKSAYCKYVSQPFEEKSTWNKLLRLIHKIHMSPKVNAMIPLPFKSIWNSFLVDDYFKNGKKYCFIFFSAGPFTDHIPYGFVDVLKKRFPGSKYVVFYQDLIGHKRPVSINDFRTFCDELYSFDYNDAEEYKVHYYPLVYSELNLCNSSELTSDVYFCGAMKNRWNDIYKTYCYFSQNGCICDYIIVTNDKDIREKYKNLPGMVFVDKFSYRQNLLHASKTKNILELMQKNGTGYTIRACEAVALKKRLVSNNMFLERASFYSLDQFVSFDVVENVNVKKILKPYCEDSDEKYAAKMKELSPLSFMHRIDCDLGGTNKCLHPKA